MVPETEQPPHGHAHGLKQVRRASELALVIGKESLPTNVMPPGRRQLGILPVLVWAPAGAVRAPFELWRVRASLHSDARCRHCNGDHAAVWRVHWHRDAHVGKCSRFEI